MSKRDRVGIETLEARIVMSALPQPVAIAAATAAPIAKADSVTTVVSTPATIAVLANDIGSGLTVSHVTQPAHGAVIINKDNTVTYTPAADYVGSDTFNYTIKNAAKAMAVGVASVVVTAPPSTPTPPVTPVAGAKTGLFAPYVDTTLWPTFDLASAAKATGNLNYTLAFIVADSSNQPSWGSYYNMSSGFMADQIASLRAMGGDVTISFGGESGTELAEAIKTAPALEAAYKSVVDTYNVNKIDFDIEGAWVADKAAIDRRSQALAALQKDEAAQGRNLQISLTLPVLPTGLTNDGTYIVQSALKAGVTLSRVNVMAMDFGDSAAPDPSKTLMGQYAIQSATSLHDQLKTLYAAAGIAQSDAQLWNLVGVTPMIGVNDIQSEVFDQTDAKQLLAFAQQKGLGELAFWSEARDKAPTGKLGNASSTDSGIAQTPWEFTKILEAFNGSSGVTPTPTPTPPPTPPTPPPPTPPTPVPPTPVPPTPVPPTPVPPTPTPSSTSVNYDVTSDWGTGYVANITVKTGSALSGWTLAFDSATDITSIWNATILSHVGNHYVLGAADWNSNVSAGSSFNIGFTATPLTTTAAALPTGYLLNGLSV